LSELDLKSSEEPPPRISQVIRDVDVLKTFSEIFLLNKRIILRLSRVSWIVLRNRAEESPNRQLQVIPAMDEEGFTV
jgi:hypothetical protein